MNFHKVASKLRTSYISDPYSLLIQYKRAYKFLKLVKEHEGKVLVLGMVSGGIFEMIPLILNE